MLKLISILCTASCAIGIKVSHGVCPEVQVIPDLDPSKIAGVWYTQYRYYNPISLAYNCETYNCTVNSNGTGTLDASFTSFSFSVHWPLVVEFNSDNLAKWALHDPFGLLESWKYDIWVLDTDYTSYADVWGCFDFGSRNVQLAEILTRNRNASREAISKARSVFKRNNLSVDNFVRDSQLNCAD